MNKFINSIGIEVEPSERDLENKFLLAPIKEVKHLPCEFIRGKKFRVSFVCLNCNSIVLLENIFLPFENKTSNNYSDFKRLSTLNLERTLLDKIASRFTKLTGIDRGHFFGYVLSNKAGACLITQQCALCGTTYFVSYEEIQGEWEERGSQATPDKFYIEEIVLVDDNIEL